MYKLRTAISQKVLEIIQTNGILNNEINYRSVLRNVKILSRTSKTRNDYLFGLSINNLFASNDLKKDFSPSKKKDYENIANNLINGFYNDLKVKKVGLVKEMSKTYPVVGFEVSPDAIANSILDNIIKNPNGFWKESPILQSDKETIVVDFSSPNIAKPFHMGHLRSTIIGNFLCNLNEALGHNVIRLNYLGDWGSQFGLLKYGYDAQGITQEQLEESPIDTLYKTYVWANQMAEDNPEITAISRDIFRRMEDGNENDLSVWRYFRDLSIRELDKTYKRLDIHFDHYHGESMYGIKECNSSIELMKSKNLIDTTADGRVVYAKQVQPKRIETLVKSNGTHLYLTRDVAAAIHRKELFDFDRMIYVTDSSQQDHFKALFHIMKNLGFDWADQMSHCDFGRIVGMSTRKGTAVFLHHLLDEARDVILEGISQSINTQRPSIVNEIGNAEVVAVNCILLFDFLRKRRTDYEFSWDAILKDEKSIGISLQYAHCRLVNLEKNCRIQLNLEADIRILLKDSTIINLLVHLALFDEAILQSFEAKEARPIVTYLDKLKNLSNIAYKNNPIKGSELNIAEARLIVFIVTRLVLAQGMKILGIKTLEKM